MKAISKTVLVAMIVLLNTLGVTTAAMTVTVNLNVVDELNQPVEIESAMLVCPERKEVRQAKVSETAGVFVFDEVCCGSYILTVTAKNHTILETEVVAFSPTMREVNCEMVIHDSKEII